MEIVGVVASSIALGQAIAAGRHIVNLCRELPEIQHEFDELRKDVNLITAMLADVQRGAGPWGSAVASNATGEMLIERTTERLQEIRNELQEFVSRCGQTAGNKTIKARRRRWLLESDKLKKLREKAIDAKMNLHFAVTCHDRDIMRAQVGEFQHQFEKFTLHIANFAPHKSRLGFEALSYNSMDEEEPDTTRSESTRHAQVSKQFNQTESSHELTRRKQTETPNRIMAIRYPQLRLPRTLECSMTCRCRCHSRCRNSQNRSWAIPFLGSWLVNYTRTQNIPDLACNDSHCGRTNHATFELKYQCPRWLWEGVMSFRASYNNIAGLRVSLRPKRVVSSTDLIAGSLQSPECHLYKAIRAGYYVVYPDDETESGDTIFGVLLARAYFEHAELLFTLWEEILRRRDLPRRLICQIRFALLAKDISPHFKFALKQIVAQQDEIGQSSVCEAILRGGRIEQVRAALAEEPWAADECGDRGHSPLTLAIRHMPHSTEVAQLLIAAGANVNQEDTHGLTPLRAAAQSGHLGCIRLLSRKIRSIDEVGSSGNTALDEAVRLGQVEVVRALLAAGAKPATRNRWRETALHTLSRCSRRDAKVIEEIGQLLTMNSDATLDAQDGFGFTPVITAIASRNLPVLRWLVNEGASLHVITDLGSILHWVVLNLDLQILRYLESLELTGIDVNGRDGGGHTAWDCFIFTIYGAWRTLGTVNQPSLNEQHAFANLYKNIRNRTLMQDISRLRQILHALSQQERAAACTLLQTLIDEKQKWETNDLYKWYKIVRSQAQDGDLDSAVGGIEDYIRELEEEMQADPWDIPSKFYPRQRTSKDDTDSE